MNAPLFLVKKKKAVLTGYSDKSGHNFNKLNHFRCLHPSVLMYHMNKNLKLFNLNIKRHNKVHSSPIKTPAEIILVFLHA